MSASQNGHHRRVCSQRRSHDEPRLRPRRPRRNPAPLSECHDQRDQEARLSPDVVEQAWGTSASYPTSTNPAHEAGEGGQEASVRRLCDPTWGAQSARSRSAKDEATEDKASGKNRKGAAEDAASAEATEKSMWPERKKPSAVTCSGSTVDTQQAIADAVRTPEAQDLGRLSSRTKGARAGLHTWTIYNPARQHVRSGTGRLLSGCPSGPVVFPSMASSFTSSASVLLLPPPL